MTPRRRRPGRYAVAVRNGADARTPSASGAEGGERELGDLAIDHGRRGGDSIDNRRSLYMRVTSWNTHLHPMR